MAASTSLLLIAAVALLTSPALSQTCNGQTFSYKNITFANCTDLPTLGASLHWSYDAAAKPMPTLSVAFTAPPASSDGWVAWGLNPSGTGMKGSQSLVAFAAENGSTVVKTYNITSTAGISESPISYPVLGKRAEKANGTITIFATLELPPGSEAVNQVWQVGSAVVNGVPAGHSLMQDNLKSKSALQLAAAEDTKKPAPPPTITTAPPPAITTVPTPASVAAPGGGGRTGNASGSARVWRKGLGTYGISVLIAASIFAF